MADILRKNLVALTTDLKDQGYICSVLVERHILTRADMEEVMCERTNAARNRVLVEYVRCRFKRAFPYFCDALRATQQLELLDLLTPSITPSAATPSPGTSATGTPATTEATGTCSVCLELPARIVFIPCGHVSTCNACAQRLDQCPMCRTWIDQRTCVYFT